MFKNVSNKIEILCKATNTNKTIYSRAYLYFIFYILHFTYIFSKIKHLNLCFITIRNNFKFYYFVESSEICLK
jgi:hypothetical protein